MNAKVTNRVPRKGLHDLQELANAHARLVTEAIERAWPVGTEIKIQLRRDQIRPTHGKVQGHWDSSVIVKLTNTKKQRVKYVHWHNVVFP